MTQSDIKLMLILNILLQEKLYFSLLSFVQAFNLRPFCYVQSVILALNQTLSLLLITVTSFLFSCANECYSDCSLLVEIKVCFSYNSANCVIESAYVFPHIQFLEALITWLPFEGLTFLFFMIFSFLYLHKKTISIKYLVLISIASIQLE